MSNKKAPPFRCAKLWPIKSCAQMCYVYLLSMTKATFLHNNFNSSDYANVTSASNFWGMQKIPEISYKFCWSVDQLTFRHKFDCCVATINTIHKRNISLYKRRNGLV